MHLALNVLGVNRLLVALALFQDFDGNALCWNLPSKWILVTDIVKRRQTGISSLSPSAWSLTATGSPYSKSNTHVWQTFFIYENGKTKQEWRRLRTTRTFDQENKPLHRFGKSQSSCISSLFPGTIWKSWTASRKWNTPFHIYPSSFECTDCRLDMSGIELGNPSLPNSDDYTYYCLTITSFLNGEYLEKSI